MSHFSVVVVTDKPDDLDAALAPFDENLEVDAYPKVAHTVADAARRARSFWLDYPQYVPQSVWDHYWSQAEGDLVRLRELKDRHNLGTVVTPGDKTLKPYEDGYKDKQEWSDRAAANAWLASLSDDVLALGYSDDYDGARIEGEDVVYDSTRNPQSKWDWWVIGGRWRGFFTLKAGTTGEVGRPGVPEMIRTRDGGVPDNCSGKADQVQWKNVDLDAACALHGLEAEREYDEYETATAGVEPPPWSFRELADQTLTAAGLPTEWDDFLTATERDREDGGKDWRRPWDDAMESARGTWREHPWVAAIRAADLDPFMDDTLDYWRVRTGGREEHVRRAVARTCVPYALVVKGEWIAKGRMG